MALQQIPPWARLVALIALLWYAFGLSQAILAYRTDAGAAPMLVWLAYGLACVAGLIGSIALFFGWARAPLAFGISLVSASAYFGWLFAFGTPAGEDYGIGTMVITVTAIMLMISKRLRQGAS